MFIQLLLLHLLVLVIPTSAEIYMGFPFNEQLPNVGRVNQDYSFTMANNTYRSSTGAYINYEVQGLPDWLKFDPGSRTFSGQPTQDNVGTFEITLVGTDTQDSTTLSNTYQMMVSSDPGLKLTSQNAITNAIAKVGHTNGGNGLVVKEGDSINLQFDKSIFESDPNSNNPIVAYYGRSADRSPLPNWLQFNSDDLSFSGTVPHVTSQNAPSFEYGFSFLATDYPGFAGADGVFKLVVGGHQLSTSISGPIKINGTLGGDIDVDVKSYIMDSVYLDGNLISSDQMYRVTADNLPDFLTFDENALKFTGKFPEKQTSDQAIVQIMDIYQNKVQLPFLFVADNDVFTVKDIPNVNATKGQFFEYSIKQYVPDNVNVTVDFDNGWLNYVENNKTFAGMTPKDFDSLKVSVIGELNGKEQTSEFSIIGVKKQAKLSPTSHSSTKTSSTKSTTSASATQTPDSTETTSDANETSNAPTPTNRSGMTKPKALAIGLGVGLGSLALITIAILLFFCCFRKPKDDDEKYNSDPESGMGRTISPPQEVKSTVPLTKFEQFKHDSDQKSTSSSITHVPDDASSHYEDSRQHMPPPPPIHGSSNTKTGDDGRGVVKSWRANADSDLKRASGTSMSTVNTEQLFSVRLVEDQSNRNSTASSHYLSNSPSIGNLVRDISGNIQRLDSDGNIVETYNREGQLISSRPSSNANLYDVTEENTHDMTQSTQCTGSMDNLLSKNNDTSSSESEVANEKYPWGFEPSENVGAKLVDFTRRGSLKDSAREPQNRYMGQTAQIQENDDSDY